MAEERAPAPLLLHLLSALYRAILHSFSFSGEQLIYYHHSIMYPCMYTKWARSFTAAVQTTLLCLFFLKKNEQAGQLPIVFQLLIKKITG